MARIQKERGDVMQVVRMTEALGTKDGDKGYSFAYVLQVLNGERTNAKITALHDQLVAMRTKPSTKRKRTRK